ncbi:MAG: hypothetical protein FWG57_06920 [Endomicrobia bacterium]|nr:hypothetical protein [Endomicrobiia bacterium]
MSVFEAVMMLCFGSAWPFSIYKSYTSRSNKGKSLWFLIIVLIGYTSGVLHKILFNFDFVITFYIFNLTLVLIDTALYFRNYRILQSSSK